VDEVAHWKVRRQLWNNAVAILGLCCDPVSENGAVYLTEIADGGYRNLHFTLPKRKLSD
jgi:hypothetical protein